MTTYVLWGSHPLYAGGTPIKLTAGTLGECRQETRYRKSDGGWTTLVIAPVGPRPWFPGDPQ